MCIKPVLQVVFGFYVGNSSNMTGFIMFVAISTNIYTYSLYAPHGLPIYGTIVKEC